MTSLSCVRSTPRGSVLQKASMAHSASTSSSSNEWSIGRVPQDRLRTDQGGKERRMFRVKGGRYLLTC